MDPATIDTPSEGLRRTLDDRTGLVDATPPGRRLRRPAQLAATPRHPRAGRLLEAGIVPGHAWRTGAGPTEHQMPGQARARLATLRRVGVSRDGSRTRHEPSPSSGGGCATVAVGAGR